MPSSFHRTASNKTFHLYKRKGEIHVRCSGPTHCEVMERRHKKRRKKQNHNDKKNIHDAKMKALKDYQNLSKVEYKSKKTTAMNLMEIVEEVKESLQDGTYLKIMDELMALNNEVEQPELSRYTVPSVSVAEFDQQERSRYTFPIVPVSGTLRNLYQFNRIY